MFQEAGERAQSVLLDSCDPMDYSAPGASVHGVFLGRLLESVVISFSRGFSHPGIEPRPPASTALQAESLPQSQQGSQERPNKQMGFLGLSSISFIG